MADAFVTSAASNAVGTLIVDYLVKPVERRLRYLFRFNKIVEELRVQEKNLTDKQTEVQDKVREAKLQPQTQVIDKPVEDWLTEVENALKNVKSFKCRIQENKRCFRWCPNWSWRYQLSKEIEQKTLDITNLARSSNFGRVGRRAALPGLEFSELEDYLASESSTSAFNEIMEALKGDEVNMIGVCGMGGVGKTTLVTKVGNEAKSLKLFQKVIKVVVSQTPNIENIQDKIADILELELKKKTKAGKAEELWLRLKNEEKILIILDDMWNELNLIEIGIPLGENHKGCTIVLTTRLIKVCDCMKSQVTVSLNVLDNGETWTLFRMNASLDNASPEIIDVANEVAKECDGLPIAIVTLARALRNEDLNGWKSACHKLKRSRLMDIENVPKEVQKNAYLCLEMSYDHLGKETTKRCLLLCALYPEDYSIDVEDLVRYAWGLRLYQDAGSIQEVRMDVFEAIKHLKNSCLLLEDHQESNNREDSYLFLEDHQERCRYTKVHDVVRDVALWIASKEDNGLVTQPGVGLENESSKQKLQILLHYNYDSKTPIDCFEGMPKLKVLSLRASKFDCYGSFFSLSALKSLKNLRTLQLEGFKRLEGISALAKLTTLEILSLHGSEVQESVDKLGELKNLIVFDIRRCKFLSEFPPNLIRRLVNVEELCLHYSTNKGVMFRYIRAHLEKNLIPNVDLKGLTSLELRNWKDLECLVDTTEEHVPTSGMFTNLVELVMENVFDLKKLCNGQPPKGFLQNLETLSVVRCVDIVSLSFVTQNLKKLTVKHCGKLQEVFRIDENHYIREENQATLLSNLEYLELSFVLELRWVLKGSTQYVSLGCLKVVLIQGCYKLESLFSTSLIRSLGLLEELVISSCYILETVFAELESDDETESNTLCLPNLKTLRIDRCPRLKYVWPLASTLGLPRLQKLQLWDLSNFDPERYFIKAPALDYLKVTDCPGLSNFTIQQDKPLQSKLRTIDIARCEKLDQIIVNGDMSASSSQCHDQNEKEMLMFPELEELCLEGLPSLTSFCPVGYHLVFPSLDSLSIQDCSKMITSFTIDSTLSVHAKTKAPLLDDTSPSKQEIYWRSREPTSLPPYVEEADEISELK